ncbi:MAG: hypothetical protein J5910_05280 [Lachnospiraceae bacterium]|nr:hypothetical protein [Lachnospiraceae bacterium]
MNTDWILVFIDYILIPVIALGIDLRRSGKEARFSLDALILYAKYAVWIAVMTYIIRVVLARLGIGISVEAGTGIYTIVAGVFAVIFPYIKEIVVTYINVRCEIKAKDKDSVG